MKIAPAKLGAEPKKVGILVGLVVVLVVVYFINRSPSVPDGAAATTAAKQVSASPAPVRPLPSSPAASLTPMPPQRTAARRGDTASVQDFKPSIKLPEGVDVSRIDPTLKLDLLAKLQKSEFDGGGRSLFEFGAAPRKAPDVAPIKPLPVPAAAVPAVTPPTTPPKPVLPPIPLKFYGFAGDARSTTRSALFLDGDDIVVARENDTIRNRFKVIRIGVNSAVIEDLQNKNQQTLPLVEEVPG
jgi:hypothetical protein